jgi:hypothetical protein
VPFRVFFCTDSGVDVVRLLETYAGRWGFPGSDSLHKRRKTSLKDLFVARVEALVKIWPDATFVVLASAVRRQLERANLLDDLRPLDVSMSVAERASYGNAFATRVAVGRLATGARPRLIVRYGPFSRQYNPRPEGRRELGRRFRELVARPE